MKTKTLLHTVIMVSLISATLSAKENVNIYIVHKFSPKDVVMNHLAVDEMSDYVYVAAQNRLFQLHRNLTGIVANVTTGPVLDSFDCMPYKYDACKAEAVMTNTTNKLLLIDNERNRLIVCNSIYQGSCKTRSLYNISQVQFEISNTSDVEQVACNRKQGSTVGIIAEGPTVNNNVLYVAATLTKDLYRQENSITTRSLHLDRNRENLLFRLAVKENNNDRYQSALNPTDESDRDYKYIFTTGGEDGFVYFVFSQKRPGYRSIIARICKSDPFYYSYVELPIDCAPWANADSLILGAYYLPDSADANNGILYILFSTSKESGSALCSITKTHLDNLFYQTMETCYKHKGLNGTETIVNTLTMPDNNGCINPSAEGYLISELQSLTDLVVEPQTIVLDYYPGYKAPKKQILCGAHYLPSALIRVVTTSTTFIYKARTEFSAITVNKIHEYLVAFIGTTSGNIIQVNLNTGISYNTISVKGAVLSDFVWDKDVSQDYPRLYVTTTDQILLIRAAACEEHESCDTCIASKDPYCGWCILESRCSTQKECKTAKLDRTRWLGIDSKQCIYANPPAPRDRTLNTVIVVEVKLLPSLGLGEGNYECVFNKHLIKKAAVGQTFNGFTKVSCESPSSTKLPKTPFGQDYADTILTLRYKQSVDIVATTATFYDCGVYGKTLKRNDPCSGCLSSNGSCTWCGERHQCVPQETDSTCETDTGACPTLLRVSSQTLIPVNKLHSIVLLAKNLPDGTYRCKIAMSLNSSAIEIPAKRSSNGDSVTCQEHSYFYSKDVASETASVSVYWKLNYIVDHHLDQTSVTFYKCSADGKDCSRCVTTDSRFNCGWCSSKQQCTIQEFCDHDMTRDGQFCPEHEISDFRPKSGPLQGGTRIHIYGVNMGTSAENVQAIDIGGIACVIDNSLYEISREVVCRTGATNEVMSGVIKVKIRNVTKSSSQTYFYRQPTVSGLLTTRGPKAGGTVIVINGTDLNIGSNTTIAIGKKQALPCRLISENITKNSLECITSPAPFASDSEVFVKFDNLVLKSPVTYEYTENPFITAYSTPRESSPELTSFLAGGRIISFVGGRLNFVKTPYLVGSLSQNTQNGAVVRRRKKSIYDVARYLRAIGTRRKRELSASDIALPAEVFERAFSSACHVFNGTHMSCFSPSIDRTKVESVNVSTNISHSVNWLATIYLQMDGLKLDLERRLKYYPDPQILGLADPDKTIIEDVPLKIKAYNLKSEAITKEEIVIMIGDQRCAIISVDGENVLCTVPPKKGDNLDYKVTIRIGNIHQEIGSVTYHVVPPVVTQPALIGIIIGAVVLVLLILCLVFYFIRKNNVYKANKNDFQKAMENMEMSVRADFRKAFAELNVDMSDLAADMDYAIPCLDYRTYVTNLFFPSYRYHPCMKEPDSTNRLPPNLEQGLSQFLLLLSNHNFLSVFIHTLEEQKSFSNRDKGNIASLLTVALHNKLDYFTEIMKSLVSDLIDQNVQRNPKLILRRSDSVAERMLSNWMYICLYPYLREKAGSPIFLLLKAIKQQVSKGALDAVTGKARYTLSDDRLLKEDVESDVLTLFVALTNSTDDEPVIVKVLSCDSVAQVKEKVMDAVYKRVPFSQRPKPEHMDIEWRHGRSGHLVLPNQDYTMEPGSRWRRLMTITDYKVANNATLALIPRQQEYEGSQDMSSIMSNHSADTSPLSPMLPEENSAKMYHLVKYNDDIEAKRESSITRDRHKHIADLYLLRLINMKGILQNYVDAVLQAILHSNGIPSPVKHFFHFLDEIAARKGITDPEVLHVWKTNSLLGRFWVTILKNPESVFDIEKPDTIASTMAVISQTFIDACSVTEIKPTKDSPINKQLYAKEIPTYKKMVQDYYKVIKDQPAVSDQDVNAYIAGIYREHGCEFDVNVALKELWGYVNKYYEEVNESLENNANISPAVTQRLSHTYSLIDNSVNGSS